MLGEVAPAAVGVVVDPDVARAERLGAELLEHPADAKFAAPSIDGLYSACAIIRPERSKSAQTKSKPSLKTGEYAVFIIATPISRQMLRSRLWSSVSSTASVNGEA